jgi:crossover junction endodeoxyribonuclease RuvC
MLVLGIDPGTAVTGYGLVRDDETNGRSVAGIAMRLVECGVIRTRPRDPLATRLREIHQGITELIARHKPDHLAVEDVFYSRNVRTTLALGHARGVVLLAGETAGIAIHEFPPAEVKKAIVGTGSATKEQVQFMVAQLLRLRAAPEPADASDGVAAAVTYLLTAHLDRLTSASRRANGAPPAMGVVLGSRRGSVTPAKAEANETHRNSGAPSARRIK